MSDRFTPLLQSIRHELDQARARQPEAPDPAASFRAGTPFPPYPLSADVAAVMNKLAAHVRQDVLTYRGGAPEAAAEATPAAPAAPVLLNETAAKNGEDADETEEAGAGSAPPETSADEDGDEAAPFPLPEEGPTSLYAQYFLDLCTFLGRYDTMPLSPTDDDTLAHLPPHEKALVPVLQREIEDVGAGLPLATNAATLPKFKKALQTLMAGRFSETVTILREARQGDPNSRTAAFLLSQALYCRGISGRGEALPEARDEAKRSGVFGDDVDGAKLLSYRYRGAVAERASSASRTLDMMRDFYLLSPDSLTGPEGIFVNGGITLRAWILLSTIPLRLWSSYELGALQRFARHSVGGAAFYIRFFRPHILDALEEGKDIYLPFKALETDLQKTAHLFDHSIQKIEAHFTPHGTLKSPLNMPWFLPIRYLQNFVAAAPLPEFDEVLLNISLDGRRYNSDAYPDAELKEQGLTASPYWHCWAGSLTADDELRIRSLIPVHHLGGDLAMLPKYEALIQALEDYEKSITSSEKWQKAYLHITPYTYGNFMDAGTGRPNSQRGPDDPFFTAAYQAWSLKVSPEPLPSKILWEHAKNGGFWGIMEVQTAFDGVGRILNDPVHGLQARLAGAWKRHLYHQANQELESHSARNANLKAHLGEFWWLYFLLGPLAVGTMAAVGSARTIGEALQMIGILGTVFGVLGGVMYLMIEGNRAPKSPQNPHQKQADNGTLPAQEDDTPRHTDV